MHRLQDEHEMFNGALADLRSDEHQQIAGAYDWTLVKTVVDVGGGAGSLLAAILESHEGTRGVLVEQPDVLPGADRLVSQRGVRARCKFPGGSFFDPIATTGEAWTMCQVLHDWPDAECRAILRRCRLFSPARAGLWPCTSHEGAAAGRCRRRDGTWGGDA